MEFLLTLIIAVSLSMDTFSLSLAYGTLGISKKDIYLLSIIVGAFHFFMPLLGNCLGSNLIFLLKIDSNFIVCSILFVIGIQMILESFKNEEVKLMKIPGFFLFAFAVSIDSFSVGLTLTEISSNYTISCLMFALCSMIFTFIGLQLGNKIKKSVGKTSTIIGGVTLLIIGLIFGLKL